MKATCPQCSHIETVANALTEMEVCCPKCETIYVVAPPSRETVTRAREDARVRRARARCPGGANWLLGALAMFVAQITIDLVGTIKLMKDQEKLVEQNIAFFGVFCLVHWAIFLAIAFILAGARALRAGELLGLVITALIADILLTALMAFRASIAYGVISGGVELTDDLKNLATAQIVLAGLAALLGVLAAARVVSIIVQPEVQAVFAEAKRQAAPPPPQSPPYESH